MDLRVLRAFVEVVRCGSFTEASKTVFATQSTVSKMVKQLEDEVGITLIDRSGQRVRPTEPGLILFQRALDMLAIRDDFLAQIGEIKGLRYGSLRIGVPTIGGDMLFAPVIAEYRKRFPDIDIQLIEHGSSRLYELLQAGELDVAGILLPVTSDLDYRKIRLEPVVVLLPKTSAFLQRKSISLEELKNYSFLFFQEGFGLNTMILEACRQHGFVPNIALQSAQTRFIAKLVEANLGVAFMPRMVAFSDCPENVTILELTNPSIAWDMSLSWRRDGYLSTAATAFIDLANELIPQH